MIRDIKALTGLRGIAAVYVCSYHLMGNSSSPFLRHGYLAVDLFFVLSGFVIALSYGKLFETGVTRVAVMRFLVRRIARVYPLYLLVTLVFLALMLWGKQAPGQNLPLSYTFVLNALMIQAWGLGGSIAFVTWSISTEWAAYLLFPVMITVLLKQRWITISAGAAASLTALLVICLVPLPHAVDFRSGPLDCSWVYSLLPVVRCVAEFYLGLATYRVYRDGALNAFAFRSEVALGLGLAILVLLALPGTDWVVVALFPLMIYALAGEAGLARQVLGSTPVHALGELSYAIYLLHLLSFKVLLPKAQSTLDSVRDVVCRYLHLPLVRVPIKLEIICTLLVASVLAHVVIERPCRKLIRKLEGGVVGRISAPAPQIVPAEVS